MANDFMTFEDFSTYIKEHILEGWLPQEEYEAEICEIVKNNGCRMSDIQIRKRGSGISPVLSLDRYYYHYYNGMRMDSILEIIRGDYERGENKAAECIRLPDTPEEIRDRIVFRLVNYRKNQEILESVPYIRFADLAITFRLIAHCSRECVSSSLINNEMLKIWGIDEDELLSCALVNTERMFPPKISRLEDEIRELTGGAPELVFEEDADNPEVYVLTNRSGINGASVILYDQVLDSLSQQMDTDFYIIPCSIHEVILIPVGQAFRAEIIRSIIKEVNVTAVKPSEYLSDSLYCYERKNGRIEIA